MDNLETTFYYDKTFVNIYRFIASISVIQIKYLSDLRIPKSNFLDLCQKLFVYLTVVIEIF